MHLSTNLEYPWILRLTEDELTIIQSVLRGDDLTPDEEDQADKLSATLDMIRVKAERTRGRHSPRKSKARHARGRRANDLGIIKDIVYGNDDDE